MRTTLSITYLNLVLNWLIAGVVGLALGIFGTLWLQSLDPEAQRLAEDLRRERQNTAITTMIRALEVYQQQLTNRNSP